MEGKDRVKGSNEKVKETKGKQRRSKARVKQR